MPIKVKDKTFATFDAAVRYCMQNLNMSMMQAKKYVGAIQAKQE
jgi:hypothetical protein